MPTGPSVRTVGNQVWNGGTGALTANPMIISTKIRPWVWMGTGTFSNSTKLKLPDAGANPAAAAPA